MPDRVDQLIEGERALGRNDTPLGKGRAYGRGWVETVQAARGSTARQQRRIDLICMQRYRERKRRGQALCKEDRLTVSAILLSDHPYAMHRVPPWRPQKWPQSSCRPGPAGHSIEPQSDSHIISASDQRPLSTTNSPRQQGSATKPATRIIEHWPC